MICRLNLDGLLQYWCLERILKSRAQQCGSTWPDDLIAASEKEYLCKWFGYGEEHSSWHAHADLSQCSLQLQQFEMAATAAILATAAADGVGPAADGECEGSNAAHLYEPLD